MKTGITALLLLLALPVMAQRNPTDPDTIDDQVANQESWYNDTLPEDLEPKRDSVLVAVDDLPQKLRKVLSSKDEYAGWQKGRIYYDKVVRIYKVFIPDERDVRIYGFSKEGHPVSFRAYRRR